MGMPLDVQWVKVSAPAPAKILPLVRTTPKIGRNEPCPCQSGKKFKKCCEGKR